MVEAIGANDEETANSKTELQTMRAQVGAYTERHQHLPALQKQAMANGKDQSARAAANGDDVMTATKRKKGQRGKGTGSIFMPTTSKYWYIAYMSGGVRRYESSRSVLKEDAQRLLSQRLGDTAKGIVVTPQVGKLTLLEGLKTVLDRQRQLGRKSVTDNERLVQRHIYKFFASGRLMATITTAEIVDYISHRQNQKAANATINRELEILRQAFTRAVRDGRLLGQPEIKLLPANVREVFFEPDEFAAVIQTLREKYPQFPEYVPILQFTCAMGWRMTSEVLPLKVSQVNMADGLVTLPIGSTSRARGASFR